MTTGKTIALTRQTFVGKVLSLLFNMLSSSVITFLPRSKHLLISWLKSPSAVIMEPPKIKSVTVSIVFPSIFKQIFKCQQMRGVDMCAQCEQVSSLYIVLIVCLHLWQVHAEGQYCLLCRQNPLQPYSLQGKWSPSGEQLRLPGVTQDGGEGY